MVPYLKLRVRIIVNEISDGQIEIEALLRHFNLVSISRSFVIQLQSLGFQSYPCSISMELFQSYGNFPVEKND